MVINMTVVDIITKKKNNQVLSYDEIKYVVDYYLKGDIKETTVDSLLPFNFNSEDLNV